jgi:hypothetical protein
MSADFSVVLRKIGNLSTNDTSLHSRKVNSKAKVPCKALSENCQTRLSVRMEQLGAHWIEFHEILYLSIFWKSVVKIQFSLKSDKNNAHFTWGPMYICVNSSIDPS